MTRAAWYAFALLSLSTVAAATKTARDYYNELWSVQGFNSLATFVCFPDDQLESFFIMGRSSEFEATLKAKGKLIDSTFQKLLKQAGDRELLYWQGFHKGVASDPSLLERGRTASEWSSGTSIDGLKVVVRITWPTLRYRLEITIKNKPGEFDAYGTCEPISGSDATLKSEPRR